MTDEELMARYRQWERDYTLFFCLPLGVGAIAILLGFLIWGVFFA